MARFQWLDGNLGFYGYGQFGGYTMSNLGAAGVTLSFAGVADPEIAAATINFVFAGYTTYTVETGPEAGVQRVTGGTLTEMHYLNDPGGEVMTVTGLSVALPIFLATLSRGDAFSAWAMITQGANRIIGADDASGPGHAGTGDVLDTGMLVDIVQANGGDDFIKDQGGSDSYYGGAGFDTLAYDGWFFKPQGVTRGLDVDLALGTITGPDGAVDKVAGIESVIGTFRADQFKGSSLGDSFAGMAGADRIDGRGGFDFASYAGEAGQGGSDGIRVNLTLGTVRDGFGNMDRIVSIEGITGTAQRDLFVDSGSNNALNGGGGNDNFVLSGGNDTVTGGDGADLFTFKGSAFDDDRITDFASDEGDRILFEAAVNLSQLHMTNIRIGTESAVYVQYASGSVTLMGLTTSDLNANDFGF